MEMEPIGVVRSPVTQTERDEWAGVTARIELDPRWAGALQGIDAFSHVLVVFHLHTALFDPARLTRRPQGRDDMPELGILAQRARYRPNPIGVTAVELAAAEDNALVVCGLDAIDGTPVLDVKPYFAAFDRVVTPREPEWVARLMAGYF
jgi:tRNA-Thr(GGU) m(6)t(6)A37 methyltransferase TsaA